MTLPKLTTTMRANAAFSAASGVAAVILAAMSETPLGVNRWLLGAIGLGLIGYGVQLYAWAGSPRLVKPGARLATAADALWVLGAVVLLTWFPDAMSTAGRWTLGLASLAVADFAVMQFLGLRRPETVTASA